MRKSSIFFIILSLFGFQLASEAATWSIDKAHSSVGFRVKHLMISNVNGQFTDYDGTIEYDPAHPENASINVTINMASVDTDNSGRDDHLRTGDFFNVENFPTMTYVSNRVEQIADDHLRVYGNLTLHGITREVVLDVTEISDSFEFMGKMKMGARATATINRTDFGLTWNRSLDNGGLVVGEEIRITLEMELEHE